MEGVTVFIVLRAYIYNMGTTRFQVGGCLAALRARHGGCWGATWERGAARRPSPARSPRRGRARGCRRSPALPLRRVRCTLGRVRELPGAKAGLSVERSSADSGDCT